MEWYRKCWKRKKIKKRKLNTAKKKLEVEEKGNKHLDEVKEGSSGTDKLKDWGLSSLIDTNFAGAKNARSSFKGFRKKVRKYCLKKVF